MSGSWYHKNPCHICGVCHGPNGCWVFMPEFTERPAFAIEEVHVCADGCDGLASPNEGDQP